jgi:hypothetical protein
VGMDGGWLPIIWAKDQGDGDAGRGSVADDGQMWLSSWRKLWEGEGLETAGRSVADVGGRTVAGLCGLRCPEMEE